jgi:hypothetical protein
MFLTGLQVVTRALRASRVLGLDQVTSAFMAAEGMIALQGMTATWRSSPQLHYPPDYIVPTFVDQSTFVDVPDGLVEALYYKLAEIIAAENGQTLDPRLVAAGDGSLRIWRNKIAQAQVPVMNLETTHFNDSISTYDIEAE